MKNWLQLQLCARAHGQRRSAGGAPCTEAVLRMRGRRAHPADEVGRVGAAPARRAQRASSRDGRDTLVRRAKPARSRGCRRDAEQAGPGARVTAEGQTLGRPSSGARPNRGIRPSRGVRRGGAPRALCAGRRRLVHVRLQLAVWPGVVEVAGGLHILDERRARVAEHGVAHHGAPACGTPRGSPSGPRRARISSQRRAVRPASKQPAIDAPWPRTAGSAASSTAQLSPACNPARALRVEPLRAMTPMRPRCGAASCAAAQHAHPNTLQLGTPLVTVPPSSPLLKGSVPVAGPPLASLQQAAPALYCSWPLPGLTRFGTGAIACESAALQHHDSRSAAKILGLPSRVGARGFRMRNLPGLGLRGGGC